MDRYFDKFQIITYNGAPVRNITQRVKVLDSVYDNPYIYYPYDIQQFERPDTIAERYYNDPYSFWLIYHSNKIIDPYYDWNLDQLTFDEFVVKKYGSLQSAIEKTLYYRNNWYSQPDSISASVYNALIAGVQKYYEPVPINGIIVNNASEYRRRQVDWTVQTNYIVNYTVANGNNFIYDEIVTVTFDANTTGSGQVVFSNSSIITLQHINGNALNGTITANSNLKGTESNSNTTFSEVNILANNIPVAETSFWSPVSYYDYENEINERNKSIQVLDSSFLPNVSRQLKTLLR